MDGTNSDRMSRSVSNPGSRLLFRSNNMDNDMALRIAQIKLRRIEELGDRLKEGLSRDRILASNACFGYVR